MADRRHLFPTTAGSGPDSLRRADCPSCGAAWWAPRQMAGFRATCRSCGTMIEVEMTDGDRAERGREPEPPSGPPRLTHEERLARSPGLVHRSARGGGLPVIYSEINRQEQGMLRDAPVEVQARWNNRTVIELVLIMAAFLLPPLLLLAFTVGDARMALHPLGSLFSAIAVAAIGFFSCRHFAFGAFALPTIRHVAEALLVVPGLIGIAWVWMEVVLHSFPDLPVEGFGKEIESFGLPAVLFMIAVVPGVFEEIAFRGIAQGRLTALYGRTTGAVLAATAFALAHTVTVAFPIHAILGFYLCWLRIRSGSLWPCVLVHMLYNACVVVLDL